MTDIHPSAIIDKTAQLGDGVTIGPGCLIGPDVVIGDGCELKFHVAVYPGTRMGKNNVCFAGSVIGEEPQIMGQRNPKTELIIGDNNLFRECVTLHRGSPKSSGKTILGSNLYLMAYCHVGHDAAVEDNVVMCNGCQIGGHCLVERNSWLSGYSGMHQFTTFGRFAYSAAYSCITADVPPFVKVQGANPSEIRGLNTPGLTRGGITPESLAAIEKAYRTLFMRRGGKTLAQALAEVESQDGIDENVRYLVDSLKRTMQHRFRRYREQFRAH